MVSENEEWRIILDSPMYSVSNRGRVKNRKKNDAILLISLINGHTTVRIHRETRYVARLVYRAFIDEDLGRQHVVHKDGNLLNNTPKNLELRRGKK